MHYRTLLYTLLAGTIISFGVPAKALADGCTHKLLAALEAQLGPSNQLLIQAKIDDQPVLLALDTNAGSSVIFDSAVSRFGLARTISRTGVVGTDGRPLDVLVSVPSLELGNTVSRATMFPMAPGVGAGNDQETGLLGADYISYDDVEIDLADHKVNLFSKDHCPGKVVYWSDAYFASDVRFSRIGQVAFDVQLDGKTLTAMLDTGTDETVLRPATASAQFGIGTSVVPAAAGPPAAFKTLAFGGLTMHNPKIAVAQLRPTYGVPASRTDHDAAPDILIGTNVIRHLRLYIAYGEGKLYYTVAQPATGAHS